jgi:hypothetical protein
VGNNPYTVPPVRRPDGTSWNNKRCCGVARSFQVIEYGVEAEFNVTSNIFANDPSWPDFSYEAMHFWPEMSRVLISALFTCDAERLAGVASADEVNLGNMVILKSP